jgi:predicted nucleic acid-binding protein
VIAGNPIAERAASRFERSSLTWTTCTGVLPAISVPVKVAAGRPAADVPAEREAVEMTVQEVAKRWRTAVAICSRPGTADDGNPHSEAQRHLNELHRPQTCSRGTPDLQVQGGDCRIAYQSDLDAIAEGAILEVPALWPLEVANALTVLVRRRKLAEDERQTALGWLRVLPLRVDHEMSSLAFSRLSELAVSHDLSVYAAAYLELAERRSLVLGCNDAALREAAARRGVRIWK